MMTIIIILALGCVLYYKPFYSLFIILFVYFEYIICIYYLITLYKHSNGYCKINIKEIDLESSSIIDFWIEFCKINAFKRIYTILKKNKKFQLISIFIMLLLWFFSIPLRYLKLVYFFINERGSFRSKVELMYYREYNKIKGMRIEIFEKKIYLNCSTKGKLIKMLLSQNKLISEEKFIKGMSVLHKQASEFQKFENEDRITKLNLVVLEKTEGREKKDLTAWVKIPHYTYVENNAIAHITSNTKFPLAKNQFKTIAMPSLVTKDAKNAGTIITVDYGKIKILPKSKNVSIYEIQGVLLDWEDVFNKGDKEIYKYVATKDKIYQNIVKEYFNLDKNVNKELISELRSNAYSEDLLRDWSGDHWKNIYNKIKNEIQEERDET